MTTLGALEKRIERLEARHPRWAGYPTLAPPSGAFLRVVLGMLAESEVFMLPPTPDAPAPWHVLPNAVYEPDDPSVACDASE